MVIRFASRSSPRAALVNQLVARFSLSRLLTYLSSSRDLFSFLSFYLSHLVNHTRLSHCIRKMGLLRRGVTDDAVNVSSTFTSYDKCKNSFHSYVLETSADNPP